MPKQTTNASKNTSKAKSAKVKKSKDSILRDHSLDLLVHGKRKRVPTLRAVEAQALLKPSKKIKKSAPKKGGVKRTHTMKAVLKDAEKLIGNLTPRARKSVDNSSPKASPSGKKAGPARSRSRNNSKAARKGGKKSASRSKSGKKSHSKKSTTKSPAKTKKNQHHDHDESEEEHEHDKSEDEQHHDSKATTPAKGTTKGHQASSGKKHGGGMKRTKTMQETLKTGNAYLKAQRGRSKSAKKH